MWSWQPVISQTELKSQSHLIDWIPGFSSTLQCITGARTSEEHFHGSPKQKKWRESPDEPLPGMDPGFSRGGDANPRGERQPIIWVICPENFMKVKKIGPRGRRARVQNFNL